MRIADVKVHRCALPLVRPFRTSFGTEYTKDVLILEVTTEDGVTGWGECVAAPDPLYSHEFNDAALLVWRDFLVPRVLGRDLTAEDVPALHRPRPRAPDGARRARARDPRRAAARVRAVAGGVLRVDAHRDPAAASPPASRTTTRSTPSWPRSRATSTTATSA